LAFLRLVPSLNTRLVLGPILLVFMTLGGASSAQQSSAPPPSTQPPSGQQAAAAPAVPHKRAVKPTKKTAPDPPPAPAPPPPPPTLEQMPALAPQVRYSHGQLSIVAENSTLADILRAVRLQTGAVVEVPGNATERVVAHLGPGPARDILAALLNGTHFNYVMVGSPAHPDSVERLILTSKSGGAPAVAPAAPADQNNQPQMDDQGVQGQDIAEQPVDTPAENPPDETPQPQPNGQPVKTPEQLLRELQQQQQQQQAPSGPPPQGTPN
jgi:hypothetical protein